MVGHASRSPFNAVVHEFPDFRKTELDVLEEFLQPLMLIDLSAHMLSWFTTMCALPTPGECDPSKAALREHVFPMQLGVSSASQRSSTALRSMSAFGSPALRAYKAATTPPQLV